MMAEEAAGSRWRPAFLPALAAATVGYLALVWDAAGRYEALGQKWPAADGSGPRSLELWLLGTPEYQWPLLRHGLLAQAPGALMIMGLAVALCLFLAPALQASMRSRAGAVRGYLALLLIGLAFQLGPAAQHRMGLLELPLRVYLPDHTSYFTDAVKIDRLRAFLDSYPERVRDFSTHTRTHPPGAVLCFQAVRGIAARLPGVAAAYVRAAPRSDEAMRTFGLSAVDVLAGAIAAGLLLLVAAATVPLCFAIGRIVVSDEAAAAACALFAASPAFGAKTPILDHALAALLLLALLLVLKAVREKKIWLCGLAGALVGVGLWLGTTLLAGPPLLILFALGAVIAFKKPEATAREVGVLAASLSAVIVGSALVALFGVGVALRVDYLEVYRAITAEGWRFNNEVSGRHSVWLWVAWNHYEMLAYAGVPLAVCFVGAVAGEGKKALRTGMGSVSLYVTALVVFMLALNFSGRVCYESSRLCWFCFPLMAIAAAPFALGRDSGPRRSFRLGVILGLQVLSVLVFRLLW